MLIGVLGQKGHGKDTVAAFARDLGYQRLAFADKLYEEVASAYGITVPFLQDRDTKEVPQPELALENCKDFAFALKIQSMCEAGVIQKATVHTPLSPRFVLERWGTDYRREHDDAYWLNRVKDAVKANPTKRYILTDVRFPNEYNFIREQGGITFRVFRVENALSAGQSAREAYNKELPFLLEKLKDEHPSVTSLLSHEVDYCLANVWGDPAALKHQTKAAIELAEKAQLNKKLLAA
jgi:hypothetical protein